MKEGSKGKEKKKKERKRGKPNQESPIKESPAVGKFLNMRPKLA